MIERLLLDDNKFIFSFAVTSEYEAGHKELVRTPEISNVRAVIAENSVEDGLTLRVILNDVVGAILQWSTA